MTTVEEIRQKSQEYLDGKIDLRELIDWVEPRDDEIGLQLLSDSRERMIVRELPEVPTSAEDLLGKIELMHTEMVCSGSFRTEEMFRADLRSLLAGEPQTAFVLDWNAYMKWCHVLVPTP